MERNHDGGGVLREVERFAAGAPLRHDRTVLVARAARPEYIERWRMRPSRLAYTSGMDVRERLRQDDLSRVLRLAPSQRAQLALDLGDRSLELLCAARNLTRAEARAFVHQARERSRRVPR